MKLSPLVPILAVRTATFVGAMPRASLQMSMVEPTDCTGDWSVSSESPYLCLAGPAVGETEYEQDYIQFDARSPDWTELPDNLVVVYKSRNHQVRTSGFSACSILFFSLLPVQLNHFFSQ